MDFFSIASEHFLEASILFIQLVSVPLIVILVVGLLVAVLQAATQIQEQSLTFVPKVVSLFLVFLLGGGFFVSQIVEYFKNILFELPTLVSIYV